jgi:hypothetical protein
MTSSSVIVRASGLGPSAWKHGSAEDRFAGPGEA